MLSRGVHVDAKTSTECSRALSFDCSSDERVVVRGSQKGKRDEQIQEKIQSRDAKSLGTRLRFSSVSK